MKKLKPGDGLYAVKQDKANAPDKTKTWCVFNQETGDVNGRWHATESQARKQLVAMYASMGDKALKHSEKSFSYLVPVKEFSDSAGTINWIDGNKLWVQMYPYDTWQHPLYGETKVDKSIAEKMVKNFNDGVTGRKQIVEYDHGRDPAKGGKAAGEIIKQEARDNGLFGLVEFNDVAKAEVDSGEWNYWSTTHFDRWQHPQTGEVHEYVPDGGSLTNKPYVRGMLPLNFSEVLLENPDLLVHEPVDEEVVEPPEPVIEPPPVDDDNNDDNNEGGEMHELEKQLRAALGLADDVDVIKHVTDMNTELTPLRELAKEHSERKEFSEKYPAEFERLQRLEARDREFFVKEFSDKYMGARVTKKEGTGDDIKTINTGLGFSALALEQIGTMAKEFSEGNPTLETFSKVLDGVLDNGIVDYGTHGSSREDETEEITKPTNFMEARKQFSDKIDAIVKSDNLSFRDAMVEAAKRDPELYQAWKEKKAVVSSVATT